MKNLKKYFAIVFAVVLFTDGCLLAGPAQALAATATTETAAITMAADDTAPTADSGSEESDNSGISDKYAGDEYESSSTGSGLSGWYKTCTMVGKTLKTKHFRYSNGGCKNTLAKAVKSRRRCNCALYVSWCLQEFGAIKKGKTFYVKGSGKLSKSLGSKVRVIRVYKKAKNAKLKPGDVVCFTTPHVCIYAGKSATGKRLWFDQGKIATYGNSDGARYKSYGKRREGYLNNRTVSYIIRIKNL